MLHCLSVCLTNKLIHHFQGFSWSTECLQLGSFIRGSSERLLQSVFKLWSSNRYLQSVSFDWFEWFKLNLSGWVGQFESDWIGLSLLEFAWVRWRPLRWESAKMPFNRFTPLVPSRRISRCISASASQHWLPPGFVARNSTAESAIIKVRSKSF